MGRPISAKLGKRSTKVVTRRKQKSDKEPPRKLSRSEDLVRQLEEDILGGKLPPGVRLDEQELAIRFKVSRTPVREALWHLASSGLIQMRRHQGAIVKQHTITELIEMFQVMAELEGLAARLAARRITSEELVQLRQAHDKCIERIKQEDHEGFFKANNEFHDLIFAASRSRFLLEEAGSLRRRVNPYRHYITYQPGRMQKSAEQHEAIVRAIENGNGEEAHTVMREHVNMLAEEASDFITTLVGLSSNFSMSISPSVTNARQ
ncbi:MAG TPA: GntR family transcriptional regulator [Aestuariivirgaceae bacterium]|nr:GntR family transcriptional regulator [Aestuariivirgaceae bacterium]